MAGNLAAAGADEEPSKYAALGMDRFITGLATQRSPLRDADVPYIQAKFYGATRFDSILDGLNTELTAKLTLKRRAGLSVYNSATFGAGYGSPYSFKWLLNGAEQIEVFSANATEVDDITTSGSKINIWSKASGAGPTRYCTVGNTMYFMDGASPKKLLRSNQSWAASTAFALGSFIIDSNGNIQQVISNSATLDISTVEVTHYTLHSVNYYYLIVTFTSAVPAYSIATWNAAFSGLTSYSALNGLTLVPASEQWIAFHGIHPSADQLVFVYGSADYGGASDTGIAVLSLPSSGTSGSAQPTWASGLGDYTTDGGLTWRCYGAPTQNLGVAVPAAAPTLTLLDGSTWQPLTTVTEWYTILDPNGNYQTAYNSIGGGPFTTGAQMPKWMSSNTITFDGTIGWLNLGPAGSWAATTQFGVNGLPRCIVDSNGNLQGSYSAGTTGSTVPTWATALGATTTDGTQTWVNCGPGIPATYDPVSYAFSYHAIDGSVCTASATASFQTAILTRTGLPSVIVSGPGTDDPQCDQIWLWRTPQGQSTLIYMNQVPNSRIGTAYPWSYNDFLPDTALNAFIAAPIANQGDPPPAGVTAPAYHLGRLWAIVGNTVVYSNGANTGTGNGNTQFPPLNFDSGSEQLVRLIPTTINGPALLVQGTTNLYVIAGSGTESDPIQPMQVYMPGIGVRNYDAITIVGSTMYAYTNRRKFISLDPSAGYTEVGFFIGDQFLELTTGGFDEQIFDPNYVSVVWHERNSGDSAIYICDNSATGGLGWFRFSPVSAPESGFVFSPFAAITGGIGGVASIEVTPGQFEMLVMPASSGPCLKRDTTVFSDNGTSYPAWTVIGLIVLCTTGEIAELAWITLQSYAVGTKAQIGVLLDEIEPTTAVPWDMLSVTSYDPPDLASIGSQTMYSDRYVLMQNGNCPKCTCVQFMIQWATEAEPNEVMTHNLYGARHGERTTQ